MGVFSVPAAAQTPQRPLQAAPDASTAEPPAPPPVDAPSTVDATKSQLDKLFERLAAARDAEEANGIASLIERRWLRSGSDTADLLMNRALTAANDKDHALAVELLDRVVTLEPNWAEAWNKRATVFFMMGDFDRAVLDVRRTLSLEPRHFGAWAGLGIIFQSSDDDKRALEAFRKAIAIHPFVGNVKSYIEKLAPDVDGRDI